VKSLDYPHILGQSYFAYSLDIILLGGQLFNTRTHYLHDSDDMRFSSYFTGVSVLSIAAALPITDILSSSQPKLLPRQISCPGTGLKQFLPLLRTINENTSDPTIFHVRNDTTAQVEISQVITFINLPPTATNYYLQWAQSVSPQEFVTVGGGTVAAYTLDTTKLPVDGVLTPEVVEAAVDLNVGPSGTGRIGSAAFGGWPEVTTAIEHLVGEVNATSQPELSFRLTLQEPGDVRLRQTGVDGWFLKYDC
jgi:hypothetical protein